MGAAHSRVRDRIHERKRQAVERGLLAAVWDILSEVEPEDEAVWARGALEITPSLMGGTMEVRHLGQPVLRASGLAPEAVFLYLPEPEGWEALLIGWADAARYEKAGRLIRVQAERDLARVRDIADRWGLAPDGSDLTTGVPT